MTTIKPEQIRWRVGQVSKSDAHKGMLLGYIDSRTAMELLDALDSGWADAYRLVNVAGDQGIECSLTVNGVTRTDVGVPSNTEGLKGAYSDALKRAAVKHGIGRELYELPKIWVKLDDYKRPTVTPTFKGGRWTLPREAGSVIYDHEPTEQPTQRGGSPSSPRAASASQPERGTRGESARPAPVQYRRAELLQLMQAKGLGLDAVEVYANLVGIPKGDHASNEQMDALIAAIEGHGTDEVIEPAGSAHPAGELSAPEGSPPPSGAPPKPGTPEYRALPTGVERAAAKAYWEANPEPEPETLAEQLQVAS